MMPLDENNSFFEPPKLWRPARMDSLDALFLPKYNLPPEKLPELQRIEATIREDPKNSHALANYLHLIYLLHPEQAVRAGFRAISIVPNNGILYVETAFAFEMLKRPPETINLCKRGLHARDRSELIHDVLHERIAAHTRDNKEGLKHDLWSRTKHEYNECLRDRSLY